MRQMTMEERNKNCTCDIDDESGHIADCVVCEEYFDQRCEEHEIRKNKRMFEAEEY